MNGFTTFESRDARIERVRYQLSVGSRRVAKSTLFLIAIIGTFGGIHAVYDQSAMQTDMNRLTADNASLRVQLAKHQAKAEHAKQNAFSNTERIVNQNGCAKVSSANTLSVEDTKKLIDLWDIWKDDKR